MENITPRTSLLNLDVRFSVHPASETFSVCFCSCECNRDKIRALLQGCHDSNYYGFHLCDVNVLSLHL